MAKKYNVKITRTREEIIELVQNGMIKQCDQIKVEESSTWQNVSTVKGLDTAHKYKNPSEKFQMTEKPNAKRRLLIKTTASFLIISLVLCVGCWGVWSAMSDTQKEWTTTKYTEIKERMASSGEDDAIDASTISDDFENNQLAAETKYTNLGAFFVTGQFHDYGDEIIDKDHKYHSDVIRLYIGPFHKVIICGLTKEYIQSLNKGDEVTFKVKFLTLQMIMHHPIFEIVE